MAIIRRVTMAVVPHAHAIRLALAIAAAAIATAPARAQGPQGSPDNAWVAPERASRRANPLPPTTDALKRGRDLFVRDCEQCHGKAGHGDGPQAASLLPRPADLTSERVQSQSDGAFFWKISEGRGLMPRATLSENDKWAVINFLRSLAPRR